MKFKREAPYPSESAFSGFSPVTAKGRDITGGVSKASYDGVQVGVPERARYGQPMQNAEVHTNPALLPLRPPKQVGQSGVEISNGYVLDDYLRVLRGRTGIDIYSEMTYNDSTVGAIIFAIKMAMRANKWEFVPNEEDNSASVEQKKEGKDFAASVFKDMQTSWDTVVADAMSCLSFGWAYSEVIYKRRISPYAPNPELNSRYTDGKVGIRKIALRKQKSLEKWLLNDEGDTIGMYQQANYDLKSRFIPIDKALHFRVEPNANSPEGLSVLRNAYRPWYFMKVAQEVEAIGHERQLNGLPVCYIPSSLLGSDDPKDKAAVQAYVKLVRDIKFNSQGGAVLPSDLWKDSEGNPTQQRMVEFQLMNAGVSSSGVDIDRTIKRYQLDIARTVLADFIMTGLSDRGSYAMNESKVNTFVWVISGFLESIAETINRQLLPKLWLLNAMDFNTIPRLKPGKVTPDDVMQLANLVEKLSRAGMPLFPNFELENRIRTVTGLPSIPEEEREGYDDPSMIDAENDLIAEINSLNDQRGGSNGSSNNGSSRETAGDRAEDRLRQR